MTTTADTREREQIGCDGCGRFTRAWRRIVLSSDGAVVTDVRMCRACESHALDAVKLTLRAVMPR